MDAGRGECRKGFDSINLLVVEFLHLIYLVINQVGGVVDG